MTCNKDHIKNRIDRLLIAAFGNIDYKSINTKNKVMTMPFGKEAWKELRFNALRRGENPDKIIAYMDIKCLAVKRAKEWALKEVMISEKHIKAMIIKRDQIMEKSRAKKSL